MKKNLKEMEQVKKNGYALNKAEAFEGVNCVAAPIFDDTGNAVAAHTITGPSSRIPKLHLKKWERRSKKNNNSCQTLGISGIKTFGRSNAFSTKKSGTIVPL